jgi:ketosteroid isomerase-like protein
MSQENVELVLGLQPGPDDDLAQVFRDDDMWAAFVEAVAPFAHPDMESVPFRFDAEQSYTGMDGFRAFFLDWLAPWARYRVEVEKAIDCREQVVVLYRAFGRHRGSTQEVKSAVSWVWTVRDGKIARVEFYADTAEALQAVGLAE